MQRLQIARAIASIRIPAPDDAELLILDECMNGLYVENFVSLASRGKFLS